MKHITTGSILTGGRLPCCSLATVVSETVYASKLTRTLVLIKMKFIIYISVYIGLGLLCLYFFKKYIRNGKLLLRENEEKNNENIFISEHQKKENRKYIKRGRIILGIMLFVLWNIVAGLMTGICYTIASFPK
jgi:hypothetical protein